MKHSRAFCIQKLVLIFVLLAAMIIPSTVYAAPYDIAANFDRNGDFGGWVIEGNGHASGVVSDGNLNLTVKNDNPGLIRPHNGTASHINSGRYRQIKIKMKNNTAATKGAVAWRIDGAMVGSFPYTSGGFLVENTIYFDIKPNDQDYTEYSIDLSSIPNWKAYIEALRISPAQGVASGTVNIDYIKIVDSDDLPAAPVPRRATDKTKYQAGKVDEAIHIDGKLDEDYWKSATKARLSKNLRNRNPEASYFMVGWDDNNLYVGFMAKDEVNVANSQPSVWEDDAMELFIDGGNEKSPQYDANDRQYIIGRQYEGIYSDGKSAKFNSTGVKFAKQEVVGGWSIEMAIPFSNLGVVPVMGARLGLDVLYDDDDGLFHDSVLCDYKTIWAGTKNNSKDTTAFGEITLSQSPITVQELVKNKISNVMALKVGSSIAYQNGIKTQIDVEKNHITPIVQDGTTWVPLKFIAEGFGAKTEWDATTSGMKIVVGDKVIKMKIGNHTIYVDGQGYYISSAPQLIGEETLVPLGVLSEMIGQDIFLDNSGLIVVGADREFIDNDTEGSLLHEILNLFTAPPVITGVFLTPPNGNGWFNGDVTVHFAVYDNGSGVASVTPDIIVSTEGRNQTVTGTAVDEAGNQVSTEIRNIHIDKTKPETSSALSPSAPDGMNGWYTQPVTLQLTGADQLSGVAETVYSADGGTNWQLYSGPVTFRQDGRYSISYRSTDLADNQELPKTIRFQLDSSAPSISVASPIAGRSYLDSGGLAVQYTLSDVLSGVDAGKAAVTLNEQPVPLGAVIPLYTLPLGPNTVKISSGDMAGNVGDVTVTFSTYANLDSLHALVARFADMKWIDNAGIANSLQRKLDHGDLREFMREVQAQSGKHISSASSAYMLRDAQFILDVLTDLVNQYTNNKSIDGPET
ncbi:sugar-binding protein [Paenibacillus rigui]|uniref:Copper amine oxidase-like N-terminal domain-containing protein n=1 Tax=Paenibacillus rigui TaxID=554312 RepID=A0A229UW67_9BACL|nr:sugar-binding protein [Paenibacillus rigui]OXM87648.1 hypothetical protein CF651_04020 [Paenibacillus rigui]